MNCIYISGKSNSRLIVEK